DSAIRTPEAPRPSPADRSSASQRAAFSAREESIEMIHRGSAAFQSTRQPKCVQIADRLVTLPEVSRNTAALAAFNSMTLPSPPKHAKGSKASSKKGRTFWVKMPKIPFTMQD